MTNENCQHGTPIFAPQDGLNFVTYHLQAGNNVTVFDFTYITTGDVTTVSYIKSVFQNTALISKERQTKKIDGILKGEYLAEQATMIELAKRSLLVM